MNIASYNILSGGFAGYDHTAQEPQRLGKLQTALQTLDADFIGLIDTFRWDERYVPSDLKRLFGYQSVFCIKLDDQRLKEHGDDNGITVLTNIPDVSFETIRLWNRNAVKSTFVYNGQRIAVVSMYLDDLLEATRLKETEALLQGLDKNIPTILMGDCNTLNVNDLPKVTDMVTGLISSSETLKTQYQPIFEEMRKGQVMKLLLEKGFKNIDTARLGTYPTKLLPIAQLASGFVKLDYALVRGPIAPTNFQVRKEPIFDEASDHYPICFTLK